MSAFEHLVLRNAALALLAYLNQAVGQKASLDKDAWEETSDFIQGLADEVNEMAKMEEENA